MVVPVMPRRDLMESDLGVAVFLLFGLDEDDRGPRADHAALPGDAQRSVDVVAGYHDGAQVGALREETIIRDHFAVFPKKFHSPQDTG